MDLDALLDEAAEATFKPEPVIVKKRVDPTEIKPYLAATALVTPSIRDKWSSYVRRDNEIVIKSNFLPSVSYQQGDVNNERLVPPNSNKILYDVVKTSATKCGFSDAKTNKIAAIVNPVTDSDVGKRLQVAYEKFIISSKKKDIESDINYDPKKFPNLALLLSKV